LALGRHLPSVTLSLHHSLILEKLLVLLDSLLLHVDYLLLVELLLVGRHVGWDLTWLSHHHWIEPWHHLWVGLRHLWLRLRFSDRLGLLFLGRFLLFKYLLSDGLGLVIVGGRRIFLILSLLDNFLGLLGLCLFAVLRLCFPDLLRGFLLATATSTTAGVFTVLLLFGCSLLSLFALLPS
jgi:hypothetical protein